MIAATLGLSPIGFAVAAGSVSAGAILRSITGFGASLVATVGLSAVLAPSEAVPVVILLDLLIGLAMLPTTWSTADRSLVWPTLVGITVGTPIGVLTLSSIPDQPMRIVIGLVVAMSAVLLAIQPHPKRAATPLGLGVGGGLSGVLNGAASAGGPPLVLAHYGTEGEQAARRATLSLSFVGMDVVAIVSLLLAGLMGGEALARFALLSPFALGVPLLSARAATRVGERSTRSIALGSLFAIGLVGIARALA